METWCLVQISKHMYKAESIPESLPGGVSRTNEDRFIKEFVHARDELYKYNNEKS